MFVYFVLFIITVVTAVIIYYKRRFQYWKKQNIPTGTATIPFGSLKNPIFEPEGVGQAYERLYKEYKLKGLKHVGLFTFAKPVYMPLDVNIIKRILLNDFDHFVDRGMYYNEKHDPLSAHLFFLEGAKWKNLRAKLTPTFSPGKLKTMFPLVIEHVLQLKEAMNEASLSGEAIDIKTMLGNYSADIVASSAFGLDCNSFKNPNSEFRRKVQRYFSYTKIDAAKLIIFLNNPDLGRLFNYKLTQQEVSDFFMKTIAETVNYRERTKITRDDFMQTLIDLKNNADADVKLTFEELAAQAFAFFAAAIETSSSTFSFCMHELAMNEDIQAKVRGEVSSVLKNYEGELTYESLSEMKYLQQVIDETQRKYPSVPILNRMCTEDYQIPGTNATLKKGTAVVIPTTGLHHDEEFYPKNEKFDPERFNEANKAKLPNCCYLPFGEGPRACIGLRFGVMQIKIGIATLLTSFKFSLQQESPKYLRMSPYSFVLETREKILLSAEKIDTSCNE